jgi:hypothetical protein
MSNYYPSYVTVNFVDSVNELRITKCIWGVKRTVNDWYSCSCPTEGLNRPSLNGTQPAIMWGQCSSCSNYKSK